MNISSRENWKDIRLSSFLQINPIEKIPKKNIAPYLPMEKINPFTRQVSSFELKEFNGGQKFKNRDTLMARITPCLENGKTAFVDFLENDQVGFGSTEYLVFREKEHVSDSKFIYYFIISPFFRNIAIRSMTGTSGRQRVQTDILANKQFRLPLIEEQKEIASILCSLDDKIELLRRENTTLEKMAQTLFQEWFVNFRFHGHEDVEIVNGLPEGWGLGKLGELFKITMGQSPSGESYNEDGEGIIFYQGRTDFGNRFPSVRLYTTEPKRTANRFDVLVSVRAPVGDINQATEVCCLGRGVAGVSSDLKSFCFYMMKNTQSDIQKFEAGGTVFGSINKDDFRNIKVIVPSREIQEGFNQIIISTDEKVFNNFLEIQTLSRLRDKLLGVIFTS
ncbi:MAG: restriction endonuclease subunit S [Candidatus Pacebacteria bacterium]|nr:restriction endonuclease subunit S [Candidatus Paceibacterota bacterium]